MVLKKSDDIAAPNFETMPGEMKKLNQWIMWKSEIRTDNTYSKVPYQINGMMANTTDENTWSSFEQVKVAYYRGGFSGVGFVFTKESRIVGLDIDNVDVDNLSEDIELLAMGSFSEVSVSGNGIHLYAKGEKLPGMPSKKGNYECYSENRFFVVTGNQYSKVPDVLEGQHIINEFSRLYLPVKKEYVHKEQAEGMGNNLSDSDIISLLERFKPKAMKVYQGDFSDYASQSEAVLGLMNELAFYTSKDSAQMENIFMSSSATYDNPKDNNRKMRYAIEKAIRDTRNVYEPKRRTSNVIPFESKNSIVEKEVISWWSENQNGTKTLLHNELATYIMGLFNFVRYPDPHGEIYFYNASRGVYEEDISGRQLRYVIRKLEPTLRANQVKEVTEYLKDMAPIKKAITKNYVAANNGLINLTTFKLEPFTPEHFITNKFYTNYNENAYDPFVESTLKKVSSNHSETIQNIKEMFACVMYKELLVTKMFYLYGRSAFNGKSSLLNMLQYTFNSKGDNFSSVTPQRLASNSFASSSIYGKLCNIVDDQPDQPIEDSGALKTIITGGVTEIERKGKNSQSVRITTTMITASNYFPNFKENGKQINRRLYIIPFEHDFSKDPEVVSDSESTERLQREGAREYVLLLAVQALKMMLENPSPEKLTFNPRVQAAQESFANHNDPMSDYYDEFDKGYFLSVAGSKAYTDYEEWAKENGGHPFGLKRYKEIIMRQFDLEWGTKRVVFNGISKTAKGFIEKK